MIPQVTTYLRDTDDLIDHVKSKLLKGELVNTMWFSFDAVSFYTNIDTDKALERFRIIFTDGTFTIPEDFPIQEVLTALEIIMRTNIFTFGNTLWIQK